MKIRALMAAVVASAFAVSPLAAQAGTSASSMSTPMSYGAHSTKSVKAKNKGAGLVALPIIGLAVASVVTAVVIIAEDKT